MLGCDHYHITLTLPSQLYRLWRYDYASFAALGFEAVRDTFFTLLADPKFLGATPGLHVTHTWNRALGFCPHYHVLVSRGGLGEDGTRKRARRKSLLPTEVIAMILRHVPPRYLRTSRAFGLYAPNAGKKRERCQALIGRIPQTADDPEVQAEIPRSEESETATETCPVCSRPLVVVAKMPRPQRRRDPKTQQRPPPTSPTERGWSS